MKKYICLTMLCLISMTVTAGNPFTFHRENYRRHDFGISAGIVNSAPLQEITDDFVLRMRKFQLMDEDNVSDGFQPFCLSGYYLYNMNDRIGIGASVGWSGMTQYDLQRYNFYYNDILQIWKFGGTSNGHIRARAFFALPQMKYTWLYNSGISLYVRGGVGAYYIHHKFSYRDVNDGQKHSKTESAWRVAYQISPVGIDFSNGPVRYFMEAGYGAEGILKIGLSCKLHRIWRDR